MNLIFSLRVLFDFPEFAEFHKIQADTTFLIFPQFFRGLQFPMIFFFNYLITKFSGFIGRLRR